MSRRYRLAVPTLLALLAAGCAEVDEAVDQVNTVKDKATVCTEALGLADLNPLVDPERLRARAEDKERRFRELAQDVADQDVKNSLLGIADSYVEVQKNRYDDLSIVARWAKRNTERLDALRKACT
jgi:hypothetical protein